MYISDLVNFISLFKLHFLDFVNFTLFKLYFLDYLMYKQPVNCFKNLGPLEKPAVTLHCQQFLPAKRESENFYLIMLFLTTDTVIQLFLALQDFVFPFLSPTCF